jgi:hemoglobin-like flavoprotein
MPEIDVEIAEASYHRCAEQPAFFRTFYDRLLASDPAIPPKFARTDFERQAKLLKHALGLLLIYAKRPNPALLERIALRHGRHGVDVPPDQYRHFLDALEQALTAHDPEYRPDVGAAWRAALAPGIAFMQSRYEQSRYEGAPA